MWWWRLCPDQQRWWHQHRMDTGQVDFAVLARSQESCTDVARMWHSTLLKLQKVVIEGVELLCDSSTVVRPLVPLVHRWAVFEAVHGLADLGEWSKADLCGQGDHQMCLNGAGIVWAVQEAR